MRLPLAFLILPLLLTPAMSQDAAPSEEALAETAPVAPAQDEALDEAAMSVQSLSPFIADVQVLGPWSSGERQGIWRTVMLQPVDGEEGNRLFVQTIEDLDGEVRVSASTEIDEIRDLNGAVVNYRMDAPSEDQPELLTLFLDIVPLDAEIAQTYELFFYANEPYVFGPASN